MDLIWLFKKNFFQNVTRRGNIYLYHIWYIGKISDKIPTRPPMYHIWYFLIFYVHFKKIEIFFFIFIFIMINIYILWKKNSLYVMHRVKTNVSFLLFFISYWPNVSYMIQNKLLKHFKSISQLKKVIFSPFFFEKFF